MEIITLALGNHYDILQIMKILYEIIKITGSEAAKFLQGQLTNDINLLNNDSWQFSCYCNQKGRLIAFIWLAMMNDSYYLCLPKSTVPQTLAELKKFGAFSKVEVEIERNLNCLTICGEIPAIIRNNATICMNYADKSPISIVLINKHIDYIYISNNDWELYNINNRLPIISKVQQEHFTPHQLDLQHKNAISFTKGCYRGQEIVARMEYLGKLKQSLYQVELESTEELKPLQQLTKEDNQVIGELVNIVKTKDNTYQALAVLNKAIIENEETDIIPLVNNQKLRVIG